MRKMKLICMAQGLPTQDESVRFVAYLIHN